MPTPFLKKISKTTGKPLADIEAIWDSAKEIAKADGKSPKDSSYWGLVTAITKKKAGYSEAYSFADHIMIEHILNTPIDAKITTMVRAMLGHVKERGQPSDEFLEAARETDRKRIESPIGTYIIRQFSNKGQHVVQVEPPKATGTGLVWYE